MSGRHKVQFLGRVPIDLGRGGSPSDSYKAAIGVQLTGGLPTEGCRSLVTGRVASAMSRATVRVFKSPTFRLCLRRPIGQDSVFLTHRSEFKSKRRCLCWYSRAEKTPVF